VGVNVTLVPEQIVVAEAAIVTDGVTVALTTIVVCVDVAVFEELQAAVDVITTSILSPLASVIDVYVAPVAPAIFVLLFLH